MPKDDFIARISRYLAWLGGAVILFGCCIPISIDVVSRAVFGQTVLESFEISGYGLAACIGLGMGFTVSTKANIRVDFLTNKLPRRARMVFDLAAAIALAVVAVALAYYAFETLQQSWRMDARSVSTLRVPLYLPQSVWWFGLLWFAIAASLTPVFAVMGILRGDKAGFDRLLASPALHDELAQTGVKGAEDLSS